jgi:hypothetical protein
MGSIPPRLTNCAISIKSVVLTGTFEVLAAMPRTVRRDLVPDDVPAFQLDVFVGAGPSA